MDRQKCSKSLKTFVSHTKAHEEEFNTEKAFLNEVRQDNVSGYELASLLGPLVPEMVAMQWAHHHGPLPTKASTMAECTVCQHCMCVLKTTQFLGKTSLVASLWH